MSSHISRKELKQDAVAAEIEHGVEYVAAHKNQAVTIGIVVAVLLAIGGGYWFYSSRQAEARQLALRDARRVMEATVGAEAKPPAKNFATEEEKRKATVEAFTKVADSYPGSTEGSLALYYVAGTKMEAGEVDAAASLYRQVADKASADIASTAKLALAQVLYGQNKKDEAGALFQNLIDHPTLFVSPEQAKLTWARVRLDSEPAEARKLLDSIKDAPGSIEGARVDLMTRLGNQAAN
jgi:predicted negative regulator of RcsB-dependent stress response